MTRSTGVGRGAHRRAQVACVNGHGPDRFLPDPWHAAVDAARPLRYCIVCARGRAQAAADAVKLAAAMLGLRRVDYVKVFGRRGSVALAVIDAVESGRPLPPAR